MSDNSIMSDLGLAQGQQEKSSPEYDALKVIEAHLEPLSLAEFRGVMYLYALGYEDFVEKYLQIRYNRGSTTELLKTLEAIHNKPDAMDMIIGKG